ncbi:signal peptidase I [Blastococcus sp. URHD0036]|uniref:signal peptidase I n=1 Tax=Blastococcus sp. URHD0036 TaxID=1380356 RepID=UPI000689F92E|nr:signal peptidase I [Blastococcus sp. URHD0036]
MPSPAAPTTGGAGLHLARRIAAWAIGLVLLTGTATALGVALYPTVTGGQALAVLSGSMTPGLPVGGMVFTRPVDPATVEVGDVITFAHPSNQAALVTHRVVAVDVSAGEPAFTTKGDANEDPDRLPVPASAVRGELVFDVPQVGRLVALLHSTKGVGVLVVLVCGLLAVSPGGRPEDDAPTAAPLPDGVDADPDGVDADSARTVVMAPVLDEPGTLLVRATRPPVPVPSRQVRLLD